MVTFGLETILDIVNSDLFGGTHYGIDGAFYIQDEVSLSKHFKLTAGFRYDYKKIDSLKSENQLSPKMVAQKPAIKA